MMQEKMAEQEVLASVHLSDKDRKDWVSQTLVFAIMHVRNISSLVVARLTTSSLYSPAVRLHEISKLANI
jgi:hypothetical protein